MIWMVLGAAVVGCVVGVLFSWLWRLRPRTELIQDLSSAPVEIPRPVAEMLDMLRSVSIVVGPHDEVLRSSVQARTYGLVRGTRVSPKALLSAVRESRQSRNVRGVDLEVKRGLGNPSIHISARCAPIGDDLMVVLAEDRTAAKRVEETRRDFVANVSHELKTPIGAISLLAETVEGAADDPDAVRRFAGRMQQEAGRLSDLVIQIIELSRLQSDDPLVKAKPQEIDKIISSAVDRCAELARGHNVSLNVAGDRDIRVLGDHEQLVEAVSNLVHNAIAYSDEGTRVAISARKAIDDGEQFVDIAVSDNGIGISAEDLQRIFERFYRVDYARSRANGGTGLGLSIVKHITSVHGGSVSVWSQVGQGSTFTIRLPILVEKKEEK